MSFLILPKLIPPLYFLTFTAHSYSSTNTIVVGIRVKVNVNIKVNIEVRVKVKIEVKVEVKIKGYMYILYSYQAYKVFLIRLLFSQQFIILAVKPVQILSSLREVVIFFK